MWTIDPLSPSFENCRLIKKAQTKYISISIWYIFSESAGYDKDSKEHEPEVRFSKLLIILD